MNKLYFMEIKCKKCGKTKTVFEGASKEIKCECGEVLVRPTGGRAELVNAELVKKIQYE